MQQFMAAYRQVPFEFDSKKRALYLSYLSVLETVIFRKIN